MRLKKIGCLILAAVISLPLALPANSYGASKFNDTSGHWAESYINTAVGKKFITGYPDGKFMPDKAVTRAEFATMVNKALGNSATENLAFTDVYHGEWYYNDVAKALAAAYTAGYDDNTFRPNNPISRQEAAVMISRIVPAYGENGNLRSYSDYRSIADWAYDAMEKVNGKGYMGAYSDGRLHPAVQLTRAQTAKIICGILDNETIISSSPVIDDDGTRLSGRIYTNNVTIDEDLGEDSATIDNCIILGTLSVKGGGTDTITINNARVSDIAVNKDNGPVRILAKGETAIARTSASQASILQTSGLSGGLFGPGFSNITVNSSAELTLRGSFPKVNVTGSRAEVTLDSGTIDALTVSGRYSDITADSSTTIGTATVNAESYFHGRGVISQMNVNADGITYETKPKRWTIKSSVDTPKAGNGTSDITFSPRSGATNVKLDAKITITFDSEMEMYDGSSITSSKIEDFVELRRGSSSGSMVSYSASVNSSKTIITITPSDDLKEDTRYYVIMDKNSVRDEDRNGNAAQSIYFTTGDDYGSVTTAFSPANGATAVPLNSSITITFSDDVVRYSNGVTISSSDSYLRDCIVFKKTNSSGDSVAYSASINSAKKIITIKPNSNLDLNQKYYVAVVGNKLKTKDDEETIPAASVTWTAGVTTPTISFSPANGATGISSETNISLTFSERIFNSSAAVPDSSYVVSAVTIMDNTAGVNVPFSASISDGSSKTIITLTPNTHFLAGHNFTITVAANSFKNSAGIYTVSTAASFTVGGSIDVSEIDRAIARANNAKANVSQSVNGTDVYNTDYWVTSAQMTALIHAITVANNAKSTVQTTAAAGVAAATLDTATNSFLSAKRLGSKINVDTTAIDNAIAAANASKNNIETSIDGTDVDPARQWVTPDQMSALNDAINTATQAKATVQSVAAANTAAGALYSAISTFNNQTSYGTKLIIVKSDLSNAINAANSLRNSTAISADGTDIATDKYWVTSNVMATFESAISTAKTVLESPSATQPEVDSAASAMTSAITAFSHPTVRQTGTKVTP